ncbi:MAG: pyridoxal-phosphate dependent enzyme [Cytophagia bacterium]|nr:pyridoxal-phosphate dependent enzyme [Cytophagia bacterium]
MMSVEDIIQAHLRIKPFIHRTPILTSERINQQTGCQLFFKCENFQKVGAFKARGAMNAALQIPAHLLANGLATHSSGNHAAALARAASIVGTDAFIVMPRTAPAIKKKAVLGYGGKIFECEPTLAAREETQSGKIEDSQSNTIADGLLTTLGDKTFPIIQQYVKEVLLVNDEEIIQAMRIVWETLKIIIEPSCAVPFAAVIKNKHKFAGKRVGIILSGGNVDLEKVLKLFAA